MNELFYAGTEYINAVYWAHDCEEYANRYVIGKKWLLNDGDREAISIMQQAQADEKAAFNELERALRND